MYVCVYMLVPIEYRRVQIPWTWSYRHPTWVLRLESWMHCLLTTSLNCYTISPGPLASFSVEPRTTYRGLGPSPSVQTIQPTPHRQGCRPTWKRQVLNWDIFSMTRSCVKVRVNAKKENIQEGRSSFWLIQVWKIVISLHRAGDVRRPLDKGAPMDDSTTVRGDCVTAFIAAASTNKKYFGEGKVNFSTDTVVGRNRLRPLSLSHPLLCFQRGSRDQAGGRWMGLWHKIAPRNINSLKHI